MVISPHLDDGVFGCGQFLAENPGATVITVMAGIPAAYPNPGTVWDVATGFKAGDDIVGARRREDACALAVLSAHAVWMDFVEEQYRGDLEPYTPDEIAEGLGRVIGRIRPAAVVAPLGLSHPEHRLTHSAARLAVSGRPDLPLYLYAEAIYRQTPGIIDRALDALRSSGARVEPACISVSAHAERKRLAVRSYVSQIGAMQSYVPEQLDDMEAPEQYWRLVEGGA